MATAERQLYVYALADPGLPQRLRLCGRALNVLPVGAISAVVEAAGPGPDPTRDALQLQHAIVVALAQRTRALLPARFGTRVTEQALRASVLEHAATLGAALDQVRGRTQMTLRVFGPPDRTRLSEPSGGSGVAYLEARRRLARHLPPEAAVIRELFQAVASAERAEGGTRGLRLTVFHLVPAGGVGAYRRKASLLQSKLAPHQVVVSGPSPPFAFAPELL